MACHKCFFKGLDTSELALFTSLFVNYTDVLYWKLDFTVNNQITIGKASLILKKNFLPTNGNCFVDKNNGTSLSTYFNVICTNWIDPDGSIATYEYMGIYIKFIVLILLLQATIIDYPCKNPSL